MTLQNKQNTMTLSQYLIEKQKSIPGATGEFTALLNSLSYSSKVIAREVRKAGLLENFLGASEITNVQGEEQQKLDDYADRLLSNDLAKCGHLCALASEEQEGIIPIPEGYNKGKYTVAFDPLDGSSNIDSNVSIGTIFSIHERISGEGQGSEKDLLQVGSSQKCAGYVLYGSSTMMVLTFGNGVVSFTLDPSCGEFLLSHEHMMTPEKGGIYSVNEGNYFFWSENVQKYINDIKSIEGGKKPRTSRYIGSLVADFHRNLLKGGIFLYPNDTKSTKYPEGKLRLLYEAAPIAFLAEQAGGMAVDVNGKRILDIEPKDLHQRTTLIVGSKKDVEEFLTYVK